MLEISEEDYAMKFAMLIILDEKKVAGMDRYTENFKYILESYGAQLKSHPSLSVREDENECNTEDEKKQVKLLAEVCRVGNIGLILRQSSPERSKLFSLLVDAIGRAVILVHFYAPDGDMLAKILRESYCGWRDLSDVQLCRNLHISRSTFFRKRQQALMYAGYFFYEAVLPDMGGQI